MSESPDLPEPVRRFLRSSYPDGAPILESVTMQGRGTLRRRPLPPLPFTGRIFVRPGSDRVMDLAVGVAGITVLRGLDAYVDGRGFTRVGRKMETGPELDQGAFHSLVIETILVPTAWSRLDLSWEAIDEATALARVPFKDGVETGTVRFDRATGFPSAFEVPRHRGGGPKVDWHVALSDWKRFGALWEPGLVTARWMDEPGPWFRMRIGQVVLDADVNDALERARSALVEADA